MTTLFKYFLVFIAPFVFMIMINEAVRLQGDSTPFSERRKINSMERLSAKCTWHCHNDTNWCKSNHVKLVKNHFEWTDPIYFGVINSLRSTGSYRLANLILFVVIFPLLIFGLLIWSIRLQSEIRKLNS